MPLSSHNERKFCFRIPSGVPCLHAVQAFERFAFHGFRVMLTMYMVDNFSNYSDHFITTIYHIFSSLVYVFATFGVFIGDNRFGKYLTVTIGSIPYLAGYGILAISAAYFEEIWMTVFFYIALCLLAIGGGAIYTCINSLMADQYNEDDSISLNYHLFFSNYIVLVVCALARYLSPEICTDISCFGGDCYMIVFLFNLSYAMIAIILFVACGNTYVVLKDYEFTFKKFFAIFLFAACKRSCSTRNSNEDFLEHVRPEFTEEEAENIKTFWQLPYFYLQLGIFWSLCSQQGSTWILQATQMNSFITRSIGISAPQMQLFFPLFYMLIFPIHQLFLIPLMKKIGLGAAQNQIFVGGVFSALSFLTAWHIQGKIAVTSVGLYAGHETYVPRHYFYGKDQRKLELISILWQIPQYFLLTFGGVFVLTAIFRIPYTRLSSNFRKIGTVLCFFSMSLGEAFVATVFLMTKVDRKTWFLVCSIVQVFAVTLFRLTYVFIKVDQINQRTSYVWLFFLN